MENKTMKTNNSVTNVRNENGYRIDHFDNYNYAERLAETYRKTGVDTLLAFDKNKQKWFLFTLDK